MSTLVREGPHRSWREEGRVHDPGRHFDGQEILLGLEDGEMWLGLGKPPGIKLFNRNEG
jgi:hypothetical protein